MPLLIVIAAILLLVILVTWCKLNTFLSFLIVSLLMGLSLQMKMPDVIQSIQTGIGKTLGSLIVVIVFGSMLGKLVAESGAGQRITGGLMQLLGPKYVQWSLMITGFVVGIPLFYNIGFVLMVPLIFMVAARTGLPAVYLGIPMLAALSVTHGYLPPHPSPSALVEYFHASMGLTLLYGILLAVPAIILAGPVFTRLLKNYTNAPSRMFEAKELPENEIPGMLASILAAMLPVLLLAVTALVKLRMPEGSTRYQIASWLGEPLIVMLLAVLNGTYLLGYRRKMPAKRILSIMDEAVKDVAVIILIIGGSGALTQLLHDSKVSIYIADSLQQLHLHPLVLAWGIAAIIRVCIGSATVAGLTTAAIVAPMIPASGVNPNLMVLATGAGSLMFSHVNDAGFWMFKEYFNLSVKDTIKTWSVMETIVSITGLAGTLVLSLFV
ncbi:Gnt-I system high-affinity gluconate transporter [Chitinophaga dinghuensis]|uniref:Gnt-I system high-affinity gluconate transporter n=1 Tax=Chitinophaga dinghuensis TaxID=1539050 RepID=A0A327VM68_9BACT|nr:gluconate:H+ symporter [Chitinophaga dinghuensis]RAJ73970.1 Gnt-I system high-affinity gluconate transporter [Chitinophaga dinghuensis]